MYLVRCVPDAHQHLETREIIVQSTGIRIPDDPRPVTSSKIVTKLDQSLLATWDKKLCGP